jgi:RimJ/RimL family protein N-acetyltransferase
VPARSRNDVVLVLEDDAVTGVAYCGRQLAVAADMPALPAVAAHIKRRRGERMIVGERETIRALWKLIEGWHPAPRLVRDRQLVMKADRESLRPYQRHTIVRRANIDEFDAIANASAEMIRHELAYDPRRGNPDFRVGVRRTIERGLWWIGLSHGTICFQCHIGPWCEQTVQLQGIWTPMKMRGRGLATASLAAICDRLLESSPTVSLYVNDFNDAAVALYRRVGFDHVGDFQTLLF